METKSSKCSAVLGLNERRKYDRLSVSRIEIEACDFMAASIHEKALVRSAGQEVVTIENYSDSGEFDTTWEKVEY